MMANAERSQFTVELTRGHTCITAWTRTNMVLLLILICYKSFILGVRCRLLQNSHCSVLLCRLEHSAGARIVS